MMKLFKVTWINYGKGISEQYMVAKDIKTLLNGIKIDIQSIKTIEDIGLVKVLN